VHPAHSSACHLARMHLQDIQYTHFLYIHPSQAPRQSCDPSDPSEHSDINPLRRRPQRPQQTSRSVGPNLRRGIYFQLVRLPSVEGRLPGCLNSVGSHEPLKPRIVPPPQKQKPKLKLGELRDEGESEHRELSGTDKAPPSLLSKATALEASSVLPPSSHPQTQVACNSTWLQQIRSYLGVELCFVRCYCCTLRAQGFPSLSQSLSLRRAFVMTDAPLRLLVQRLLPRLSRSCATTLSINPPTCVRSITQKS
jgi:hypothetical protein